MGSNHTLPSLETLCPGKDLGHPLSIEESGRPPGYTGRWPLVIERRLNLESNAQDEYSPLRGDMTFERLVVLKGHSFWSQKN